MENDDAGGMIDPRADWSRPPTFVGKKYMRAYWRPLSRRVRLVAAEI